MKKSEKTPIYHITHIKNLSSIIQTGGLWCDTEVCKQSVSHTGIAYSELKTRRSRKRVPIDPGGVLADYVPFYFANRSPMLLAIHRGQVDGYSGGQEQIVYLVSSVEMVEKTSCRWCFSEGHAVEAVTAFFQDVQQLDRIDWDVIRNRSWANTDQDPDRKRRKQAEFLVHQFFPWDLVESIAAKDAASVHNISRLLTGCTHRPSVFTKPDWYY